MVNRVQAIRSSTAGNRPTGRLPGEIYTNWADRQLGVIDSSSNAMDLVGVRYFSTTSNYSVGDFVIQGGGLYRANGAVAAGAFNAASWTLIGFVTTGATAPTSPATGQLWFNGSQLQVYSGSSWMSAAGVPTISTGTNAPANPVVGQLWYNGSALQVYYGGAWSSAAGVPIVSTGATAPTNPATGQLWWNGTVLQVYSGSAWLTAAISTGTTAPTNPVTGQLWYDGAQLQIYYGNQWILCGGGGGGISAFSISANYVPGDVVSYNGEVLTANKALSPGPFAPVNFTSLRQRRNRVLSGTPIIDMVRWGIPQTMTPASNPSNYVANCWSANIGLATTAGGGGGSITVMAQTMNCSYGTQYPSLLPTVALQQTRPMATCLVVKSNAAYTVPASNYGCCIGNIMDEQYKLDWAWGTSQAQPITMSFMVYATQAGTWGGCLQSWTSVNTPTNTQWRIYPFTYSIPTANTWTQIAITIPGDTALPALWQGATNGSTGPSSMYIAFDLGTSANMRGTAGAWVTDTISGARLSAIQGVTGSNSLVTTNGALWAIGDLQVELGTVRSPPDYRNPGEAYAELSMYYYCNNNGGPAGFPCSGGFIEAWNYGVRIQGLGTTVQFPNPMMWQPAVVLYALDGSGGAVTAVDLGVNQSQSITNVGPSGFWGATLGSSSDVAFYYQAWCEPPW